MCVDVVKLEQKNCIGMPVVRPNSAVDLADNPAVPRRNYDFSGIPCEPKCFAQVYQIPGLGLNTKKHFWIGNVMCTMYLKSTKA